jgi:hypothetical protein
MNYDSYVISFMPGSSGRFLRYVLNGMITKSDEPLILNSLNHAHNNNIEGGARPWSIHSSFNTRALFDEFDFEDVPVKILATHLFPDWEAIERRKIDSGIIVIGVQDQDLLEVTGNALLKNNLAVVTQEQVIRESEVIRVTLHKFINYAENRDKLLIINYSDFFKSAGESYIALKKLEEFTGLETTDTVLQNYMTYVTGRDKLISKKMKWLNTYNN